MQSTSSKELNDFSRIRSVKKLRTNLEDPPIISHDKKEEPSVVVVGSSNIDLVTYSERLPKEGETLKGLRFQTEFGGKGANQAVAAARLGAKVCFVTCLGDDIFGNDYLLHLQKEGIDCSHVQQLQGSTGVAQICVDQQGRNFIVIVAGANAALSEDCVAAAASVIQSARVMVCQAEIPVESTLAALQLARKQGLITLLNAAPADPCTPKEVYEATEILCINEPELETIAGMPTSSMEEISKAAISILQKGPTNVVVTMGSQGALWIAEGVEVRIATEQVSAVDTVGAGDAFVGALACFLSRCIPLEEALRKACKIATITVLKTGAQSSYPYAAETCELTPSNL